jgi:hypothetical protein
MMVPRMLNDKYSFITHTTYTIGDAHENIC